ncbi:MAG: pyridoxal phosphate-dependent aminotransferase [Clostridia bacterium]
MTLAISAMYKDLVREGKDAVNFSVGEPDFDTPQHICDATIEAINSGFTRYTTASGIPELKEAICKKLKKDNGLDYTIKNIIVGTGAKQPLFNAFLTLCEEGDEVLVPAPFWVSYSEMVKVTDATPVYIECSEENDFKLDIKDLENAITENTKCMIFNSPGNPTGTVYTKEELKAIADLAVKYDFYIISDEIYEKLIYDGLEHVSIASFNEEIKKRTVVINGMSKAYAMTGWRLGYAAASEEIIASMNKIQGHSTSNPTSFVQKGALAALEGSEESVISMREQFDKRRNFMVEAINKIAHVSCRKPGGAFYVMLNIKELFGKEIKGKVIHSSMDFAIHLLETSHVATVPGSAFGMEGFVRLSYATSMENIEEGLKRIAKFVK